MGIPTNTDSSQASSSQPTNPEAAPSAGTAQTSSEAAQSGRTPPQSASDLPPEAIDLATKLFNYARDGKTDEIRQYVEAGIPVNLTNQTGDSILMLAAYHGHASTVKELVARGADVNVLNDRGQAPIAGACFKGHIEVVRALHEAGADIMAGQPTAVDCVRMFKRNDLASILGVDVTGPVTGTPAGDEAAASSS